MIEPAAALNLLDDLIAKAKAAGAEAADALVVGSVALSHAQRLGQVERLEREESQDLGLRVLIGKRQAMASSTDTSPAALAELVERAVAMARSVPEDSFCGLAEPGDLAGQLPELEICDDAEPGTDLLIERARVSEEAARAVAGVTNSEGAEASWRAPTALPALTPPRATGWRSRSWRARAWRWSGITSFPAWSTAPTWKTPRRSAGGPASGRCAAWGPARPRPARCRWSSIRGSQAA
jgi:hypothetical protein